VPDTALPTHEERFEDLRAVMDAAGSKQAAVFGVSEGANLHLVRREAPRAHARRGDVLRSDACYLVMLLTPQVEPSAQ
jgi:hypothetical protein